MDGTRFDALARSLATGRSRRGVLGGLLGLGAGLVGLAATEAACPPGAVLGARGRCLCKKTGRPPANGTCSRGVCDPEAPLENCAADVVVTCDAEFGCAGVEDVDGGCACVTRFCTGQACATGADCASGLCINAPGCCGVPNPFCALPCGAPLPGGAVVAAGAGDGWR